MHKGTRAQLIALAAALVSSSLPVAASAADTPRSRLVHCGSESCLLVSGKRETPQSQILINDRPVAVDGERHWRVILPLDAVRAWSSPGARAMTISVKDAEGRIEDTAEAALPIGLLGNVTTLAALVIIAR